MLNTSSDLSPRESFKQRLKGGVIVCLFHILSGFSLSTLRCMGVGLGRLLWFANNTSRRVTETNLAVCFPEMNTQQRQLLAKRSLVETSKTALEIAGMWLWPLGRLPSLINKVSGKDCLLAALADSRGVILLTPHIGNWEVVGIYASQLCRLTVLYTPAKLAALEKILYNGRTRNGYRLAPANAQGVKALLRALKAGETIGILPDQVPEPESGEFAPFFARPALTMTLVASLATRTGAKVICAYAKRLDREGGFEICFCPVVGDVAAENTLEALTALNRSVEACVRDCPEQYQWEYKRFRKQPAGLSRPY